MAYGTSNKYIVYSINTQQVTNDIATNATWLKVWIDVWRTNSGYSTYGTGTVYCRINGGLYSAGISTSQRITSTPIRIGEWDVTIPHQPDGTASISITAWFSHSQFNSSEQGFVLTLNTIRFIILNYSITVPKYIHPESRPDAPCFPPKVLPLRLLPAGPSIVRHDYSRWRTYAESAK